MNKIFIISDTHFGHSNIIRYEDRPYNDIEEMNDSLIKNWNQVVKNNDIIFHLGDFAFANKEGLKELINALNGRKMLIMGNHDRQINRHPKYWRDIGFEEVFKYPIIYKEFFILSHEPVYLNENMPYVNIHGHIHSTKYSYRGYFNACVENINYTPIEFEAIKKIIRKNNENFNTR